MPWRSEELLTRTQAEKQAGLEGACGTNRGIRHPELRMWSVMKNNNRLPPRRLRDSADGYRRCCPTCAPEPLRGNNRQDETILLKRGLPVRVGFLSRSNKTWNRSGSHERAPSLDGCFTTESRRGSTNSSGSLHVIHSFHFRKPHLPARLRGAEAWEGIGRRLSEPDSGREANCSGRKASSLQLRHDSHKATEERNAPVHPRSLIAATQRTGHPCESLQMSPIRNGRCECARADWFHGLCVPQRCDSFHNCSP